MCVIFKPFYLNYFMNMKYILLLLLFLPVASAQAQRMVIEDGSIYIESFGVRSDLVSPGKTLKQEILSDNRVRTRFHQGVASPVNILVSRKFQVAKQDALPASNRNFYQHSGLEPGKDGRPGTTMTAAYADNREGCDDYYEQTDQSDKGQWRLPTINEYILMATYLTSFNLALEGLTNFITPSSQFGSPFGFWYFSSTTYDGDMDRVYTFQWYPASHEHLIDHLPKTGGGRARCIRDVE